MSSTDVVSLLENSKELDRVRKEQEEILSEINKLHKKLQTTPEMVEKPGDTSLTRLKVLYTQAKDLSESEASISNLMLSQIDGILPTGPQGQTRRRIGKGKVYSLDTHLCCHVGQSCIVLLHEEKGEGGQSNEFEVLDEEPGDDEESNGQRQYKLPMGNIIAFPKSNDPSSAPDFPPGKHVLAVYPGTTALYKATVVQGPRRRKTEDYVLEFDDDEEDGSLPQRTVPFHKVVLLPEGHRQ
ncbi:hypothetical protein ACSQ67_025032 [Phaseolus vulgaris]